MTDSSFQNGPLPMPADGGLATTTTINSSSVVGSYVRTINATTTNELRIGQSRLPSAFDIPYDKALFDQFGIKGIPKTNFASSNDHGLTRFTPSGYAELGSRSYWPNTNNIFVTQFNDVLFHSAGKHGLKAGFEFKHVNVFRNAARFARGQMAFTREFTANPQNRANTGDGFAEFMLGWASGGSLGYDIFFVPTFPDGRVTNFLLDYSQAGAAGRLQMSRPQNGSDCGCDQNLHNFGPRVGVAYRLANKTVLRSGFGIIFAQADSYSEQISRWTNQSPDFVEYGFATLDRITPRLSLQGGFPAVQLPATAVPGPASVGITAQDPRMPDQYSEQWFFDFQRELPFDTLMTIGYPGMRATSSSWV